jgi:hypothetical protein
MNTGHREKHANFKRSVSLAKMLSWLEMTNPEIQNTPEQGYVIADEGKRVV